MRRHTSAPIPSTQALALLLTESVEPDRWDQPVHVERAAMVAEAIAGGGVPEDVACVEHVDARGVPARLYMPRGDERAALVWFHGGGWVLGDLDCCDAIARILANRASCAVLSVDYRLAPEFRYPAAIEDAWAATLWACERFERVAIGGDSAGGNLAAAVALRARDHRTALALQVLVYPALDSDLDAPYRRAFMERYDCFAGIDGYAELTREGVRKIWATYIPDPARRRDPDASPMYAPSLRGVAPALLVTAEHDIFTAETVRYEALLRRAGIPVEHHCYVGQIHSFFHLPGMMDDAHAAAAAAAQALRRAFAGPRE